MKNKRTEEVLEEGAVACASDRVWISKDSEVDEEIDQEAREFLNDLQESKKRDRMIVGWRPE